MSSFTFGKYRLRLSGSLFAFALYWGWTTAAQNHLSLDKTTGKPGHCFTWQPREVND
jgi:hypothetical protein